MVNPFDFIPQELLGKDGKIELLYEAKENDIIAIYFSAHWCPPCRGFTPVLAEAYNEMKQNGKKIEIIFCSSDRDQNSFDEYFNTMPWIAIPFDSENKEILKDAFEINGIPTLLVFNKEGNLITRNGRNDIMNKKAAAFDDWMS